MSTKPHVCVDVYPPNVSPFEQQETFFPAGENARPAIRFDALWTNFGINELHVRFLDGDPTVQAKVEAVAHQWSSFANIRFIFDNASDAQIRISFLLPGSWSYIGTDAMDPSIATDQATMNFGWLDTSTANDEIERVVLHEFGHALGLIHEHQNPEAKIPWNKQAVYDYYSGPPNNWTQEQVDVNLFKLYDRDQVKTTAFDRESIMLYPLEPQFLTDPAFAVGWNKALSEKDKQFIGVHYPFPDGATAVEPIAPQPKVGDILVNGPALSAAITTPGSDNSHTVLIASAGRYQIETAGNTDTVLSVYGPDDTARLMAVDDDSGPGRNSLVDRDLEPGLYTLHIRFYRRDATGSYQILVRQVA